MKPRHTPYHPRWHRERMPIFWWLRRFSHARFITRELTSLFVAFAAVVLLLQVRAVARGAEAYAGFERWLERPWVLAWHGVVLAFLLFHAVTWFALAPKAMVVRAGGRRIPSGAILAGHWAAWLVASAAVAWILAGGGS